MEEVKEFTLRGRWDFLNPARWSEGMAGWFIAALATIIIPLCLVIGVQPVASSEPAAAEAAVWATYPTLTIGSIDLDTPVQPLALENHQLTAPATIAGSYSQHTSKLFLIGHSSTVFRDLHKVRLGDLITYDSQAYRITEAKTLEKSAIDMNTILAPASQTTIVLMTCAGDPLPGQDATHRLIITAELVNG